jgi:hypothetical protein
MLYPTELRARPGTISTSDSGDFDYSGNFGVDEDAAVLPGFRHAGITLSVGPKHFFTISTTFWPHFMRLAAPT